MRLRTIAIFLAGLALAAPVTADELVTWDTSADFAAALARAKKAKKFVFVDFYARGAAPAR
jgi:hypothetical protein